MMLLARRGLVVVSWVLSGCCLATAAHDFNVTLLIRNLYGGGTGSITVTVHPAWAPIGAGRFADLVRGGVFDGVRFFRVIDGILAQFGLPADPAVAAKWSRRRIKDENVLQSNRRGRLSFAKAGPNTRTTQIFINLRHNTNLDGEGFAPFAEVVSGLDFVDRLYGGYGEAAPHGAGPRQATIRAEGNAHLEAHFPLLSYVETARLAGETSATAEGLEGSWKAGQSAQGADELMIKPPKSKVMPIWLIIFGLCLLMAYRCKEKDPASGPTITSNGRKPPQGETPTSEEDESMRLVDINRAFQKTAIGKNWRSRLSELDSP